MNSSKIPDPSELVEVFRALDPTLIQIAQDFLADADIECFVLHANASRLWGPIADMPARLLVFADDAAEASERLKELGFDR
jgi:Putative prokaryotic signal transducing protein